MSKPICLLKQQEIKVCSRAKVNNAVIDFCEYFYLSSLSWYTSASCSHERVLSFASCLNSSLHFKRVCNYTFSWDQLLRSASQSVSFLLQPLSTLSPVYIETFNMLFPLCSVLASRAYTETKIFRVLSGYKLRLYPTLGWDTDTYPTSDPHTLSSSKETSGSLNT